MYINISHLSDAQIHQINTFYLKSLGQKHITKVFNSLLLGSVNNIVGDSSGKYLTYHIDIFDSYMFILKNYGDSITMQSTISSKNGL